MFIEQLHIVWFAFVTALGVFSSASAAIALFRGEHKPALIFFVGSMFSWYGVANIILAFIRR